MKPSQLDPWEWEHGGRHRAWVVAELRRRPPEGLGLPVHRHHRWWLLLARAALLKRQNETCAACGIRFEGALAALTAHQVGFGDPWPYAPYDVDHVVPLADDGDHALDNMQILCKPCHNAKTQSEGDRPQRRAELDRQWAEKQALRERILALLTARGPLPARDIAQECGITTPRATGHLVGLQAKGHVRSSIDHGWELIR